MTLPPIVTHEPIPARTQYRDKEWTYEEILELFPDGDGSLVNPLLRRCQALEKELEAMHFERDLLALNWHGGDSGVYVAYGGEGVLSVVYMQGTCSQHSIHFPAWHRKLQGAAN